MQQPTFETEGSRCPEFSLICATDFLPPHYFWPSGKVFGQKNCSLPLQSSSARPLSFKRETHESSLFSYQRFTLTIFWINFTYMGQTFILCRRRLVRGKKVLLQIHCRFGCGTLPISSTIDKHSSKEFEKINLFLKMEKTKTNRLIFGKEISFKTWDFFCSILSGKAFSRIMDVKVESNWFNDTAAGEKLLPTGQKSRPNFPYSCHSPPAPSPLHLNLIANLIQSKSPVRTIWKG